MIDFSGLFIVDEGMDEMDSQSDIDCSEDEIDEDGEAEIQDDAQLLKFVTVLQDAQVAAQLEEKERMGGRKRKKHYTGNSLRSEQRHAANRRKLAQDPTHQFISQFFPLKKDSTRSIPSVSTERNEEQVSLVTDSIENDAEAIDEIVSLCLLFSNIF
ncbi:hypothetical protein M422DRAFT_44342 [Sphaerobolus stellatus SS14]|nr:hypothetical protein M422DRAFT_44342 [Sphaerobolus stellatus SS14]